MTIWDGPVTLLAPVTAIVFALLTRKVVLSLAAAVVVGAVVAAHGSLGGAATLLGATTRDVLGLTLPLSINDNLTIVGFSLMVGATVGTMQASGGLATMVHNVRHWVHSRRSAMLTTWISGTAVFFDDYANCLVVGGAMGPVCDKHRVSRAKLAYIVDSTAAPLASLAIVSTWVGYEVGLVSDELSGVGAQMSGFAVFLQALPYRFYCILTLVFVGAIAWTGRDFGAMRRAELAVQGAPSVSDIGEAPLTRAVFAVVPIGMLVWVTLLALYGSGLHALGVDGVDAAFSEVLGASDPFVSMALGAAVGWGFSLALPLLLRQRSIVELCNGSMKGAKTVLPALAVLFFAWTLASIIKASGTADFLSAALDGHLSVWALPALVFVLAAATAMATGSSFFTMGALIPVVLPLAWELGGGTVTPMFLAAVAAVLDGAVFGDHASPISDTTVLSAMGSGCDVASHVRTQLPYAATVALITLTLCAVPAALGVPPILLLAVGAIACVSVVRRFGRTT